MEIKPIKNERDYCRVMQEIETQMDAKANTAAGDRLDVLVTLAEAWEEKHHPIEAPDPIAAICFAMEQRGLTRRDLEPYIGSRARVAEVLNHKRSLTPADDPSTAQLAGHSRGSIDPRGRITLGWIAYGRWIPHHPANGSTRAEPADHVAALMYEHHPQPEEPRGAGDQENLSAVRAHW